MKICLLALLLVACGSDKSDSEAAKGATPGGGDEAETKTKPETGTNAKGSGAKTPSALARVAADPVALAKGEWGEKLLGVAMQYESCADRAPAMAQLAKAAEADGQTVWAAAILGTVAYCQVEMNQPDEAIATLTRAVDMGYSDCFFVRTDEQMKRLADRPELAALLDRMPTTMADVHELAWQAAEVQAVMHDTNMMITENMNRSDGDQTLVPQSQLPTRATADPSVLVGRVFLASLQLYQRSMVMQSDQSRMSHNVNMDIINNMGESGYGTSQTQVLQSAQLARQAAEQRAQQVAERAFRDQGASADLVACSAIPD